MNDRDEHERIEEQVRSLERCAAPTPPATRFRPRR
jgi:hypothetical protein